MPFSHHIDASERTAHVTFYGSVDGRELLHALVALYEDPAWNPAYHALWDFRLIDELLLLPEDFVALKRFDFSSLKGTGRDALVTARPLDFSMGLVLVKAAQASPRPISLFKTEAEAQAWLKPPATPLGLAA